MNGLVLPELRDVEAARERIRGHAVVTPVLRSSYIDETLGAEVFFKCENFQRTGAFKFRGACNAVLALDPTLRERGVATHSSGNHAAALAAAAGICNIPVTIVMPRDAPQVKKRSVQELGADIVFCEPNQTARETALAEVIAKSGATLIHPYNDFYVMSGQGTAACELLEEIAELDAVVAPVGGGGLLSGTATAVRGLRPSAAVLGAEPTQADDARRSLESKRLILGETPQTIADGLRTSLGPLTFATICERVTDIVLAEESEIISAMRLLWERLKIVVEPSAAVPLAALLAHGPSRYQRIGVILSGGNVDLDVLPWQRTP